MTGTGTQSKKDMVEWNGWTLRLFVGTLFLLRSGMIDRELVVQAGKRDGYTLNKDSIRLYSGLSEGEVSQSGFDDGISHDEGWLNE
jgi:hypothetical protein